jgi:hypothetical protein
MKTTGKGLKGPGADLWRVDANGAEHLAIVYHGPWRKHRALGAGLDEARGFLKKPGLEGLLSLLDTPEPGIFVYDLRGGLSVAEILEAQRRMGKAAGLRAGLELAQMGAEVLAEAAGPARKAGLSSHGDLSPWRLVVDAEGYLDVCGYGLLPLAVRDFLEEKADTVPADGLRYAPPERLEMSPEDIRSDLFSLTLIAAEMITGKTVFSGDAESVIEALLAGEAPARIEKLGGGLSDAVLDLLCIATELDAGQRYQSADEYLTAVKRAAREASGPGLLEVLAAARGVAVLEDIGPAPAKPAEAPAPKTAEAPRSAPVVEVAKPARAEPVAAKEAPKEPVKAANDPLAPPSPLPKLPGGADLGAVRERAKQVVARVKEMVVRCKLIAKAGQEEADGGSMEAQSLARRLQDAAGKVEKAAGSAERSAGLVELDEDAADAMVTLGLVTGAEQQAQNAHDQAREWLEELRGAMRAIRAEKERVGQLAVEAREIADGAEEVAKAAASALAAVEREMAQGALSAAGVEDAVERARSAASRARVAAEKARAAAYDLASAKSTADGEAYAATARTAAAAAERAKTDVVEAVEAARRAEVAGLESARAEVRASADQARRAAQEAEEAIARAREALIEGPDADGQSLVDRATPLAGQARRQADAAEAELQRATAAGSSAQAREASTPASKAARSARDAADQVVAASRRAIQLAGVAAQAFAALNAGRSSANALVEGARGRAAAADEVVQALLADTAEVTGREARAIRDDASRALSEIRETLEDLEGRLTLVGRLRDADQVQEALDRMRPLASKIGEAADRAAQADARCRRVAADELVEIQRENQRLAALQAAAGEARTYAEQCRTAVDKAWARYRGLPALVTQTDIKDARALLKQAFDIIDIAEYQAGEAATAAKDAGRQGEPREARGYAESAASFWERIAEDLPEAMRMIDEAEEMATAEARALEEGRTRTAQALQAANGAKAALDVVFAEGSRRADAWPRDKAVQAALERIRKALAGVADDVQEATWARDRAAGAAKGPDALEVVPRGEEAARRVGARQTQAEAALRDLVNAVAVAEAEIGRIRELQAEAARIDVEMERSAAAARASQDRLAESVARNGASGPAVLDAQGAMDAANQRMGAARRKAKAAADELADVEGADRAEALAVILRDAASQARLAVDEAERALAAGVHAAEAEARARAEAEEKQKNEAREAARGDAVKARNAAAAVHHTLDQAAVLLAATTSSEAKMAADEARALLSKLEGLAHDAERAASRSTGTDEADGVLAAALDAREASQRAAATARHAMERAEEARRLAEEAAEMALALDGIRAEMADLAARADDALKMAREQSVFLDELLAKARTDATRALRGEADEALARARASATKVHTALPMVTEAESIEVARHMLQAGKKAVQAAQDAAGLVPTLVGRAEDRLREEAEEARRALEAAKQAALAPLDVARKQYGEGRDWMSAGQDRMVEFSDDGDVIGAFSELAAAVATMEERLKLAEEAASAVAGATSVEAAGAIRAKVRGAAEQVQSAWGEAKGAHEALGQTVATLVRQREALAKHRAEVAAAMADAEATLKREREAYVVFEGETKEVGLDPADITDLLERVEDLLRNASDAAHRAKATVGAVEAASTADEVEAAASVARDKIAKAREAIAALRKGLDDGADEVVRMVEEADARKKAEEAAKAAAAAEEKRLKEEADRDAMRRSRPGAGGPVPGLRPAGPPGAPAGGPRPGGPGPLPARPGGPPTRPGAAAAPPEAAPAAAERPPGAADRRLERPSRLGDGPRRLSREDAPAEAPAEGPRRLSRSSDGSSVPARPEEGPRRLRPPSEEAEAPADRRLRPPGEDGPRRLSREDGPRRLSREGAAPGAPPPAPPAAAAPEPPVEASDNPDRDDVRSRLRERRAQTMGGPPSGRGSGGGAAEMPVRPGAGPRPAGPLPGAPGGPPRPRLPGRPDGAEPAGPTAAEGDGEGGADLLRRRLQERSAPPRPGGPPAPPGPPEGGPARSVQDLMSRLQSSSKDTKK